MGSSALGINGAALPPGVVPAGPQLLAHHLGKREADAEADADADADAQFLGLNTLPIAPLATGPAPVALAAAPVAPVALAAPVAVAPQCQQQVERKCRQVPVQSSRTIAVPRCVAVPKCVQVPHCVAVPRTHCKAITRQVPHTVCNPKPVTKCTTVTRTVPETNCVDKPVTDCRSIPISVPVPTQVEECTPVARQVCKPVHKKVARKNCSVHRAVAVHPHTYGHSAKVISPVAVLTKGVSHERHGRTKGTNYAYGVGKSFSRRDY